MSLFAKLLILLLCLQWLPAFADPIEAAQSQVQASHSALMAAEQDYRQRRAMGGLPPAEAADYRAFIAQLRQRFFAACTDLSAYSPRWIEFNTPCPPPPPPPSRPAAIDQAAEQTPGERVTAHSRDLDAALSAFDEMLLREQERVKAARPPSTASVSFGSGGQGNRGGREAGGEGDGGDEGTDEGTMAGRSMAGEAAGENAMAGADERTGTDAGAIASATGSGGGAMPPGRSGPSGGGQRRGGQSLPPDIPDSQDDDVVARQLREAAQAETDPVLRERLWDEYRRYKRGTP